MSNIPVNGDLCRAVRSLVQHVQQMQRVKPLFLSRARVNGLMNSSVTSVASVAADDDFQKQPERNHVLIHLIGVGGA